MTLGIERASLRPATIQEVNEAKGSSTWRCVSTMWDTARRILGTVEILRQGSNVLAWDIPFLQRIAEKVSYQCGLYPTRPLVKKIFTFIVDCYSLEDQKLIIAFFSHCRNGSLFEDTRGITKIYEIFQAIFPEEEISKEDFMFTCNEEKTKFYHRILGHLLNKNKLSKFSVTIQTIVDETLEEWNQRSEQGEHINVTAETRLLTSKIITFLMFGRDASSQSISQSIHFINDYIIKEITQKTTPEDRKQFYISVKAIRKAIQDILKQQEVPFSDDALGCTDIQKKGLMLILFFAGQETTASLLTFMLWKLASDPNLQTTLSQTMDDRAVSAFLNECMKKFQPVYAVDRKLKTDACFEIKFKNEETLKKIIMYQGQTISASLTGLAKNSVDAQSYKDWLPFGAKIHKCPGESLAIQELLSCISTLTKKYTINTEQNNPITIKGSITAHLTEDVYITLKKNEV